MFRRIFLLVLVCMTAFYMPDVNGYDDPIDQQTAVEDRDDVTIGPETSDEEASMILKRLLGVEKQSSPKNVVNYPLGSLWDKESSIEVRLTDLRERSLLANWIRTGELNSHVQCLDG